MGYSWGDDSGSDWTQRDSGYDYDDARQAYQTSTTSSKSSLKSSQSLPFSIGSNAPNLILCRIDVTGSNVHNAKIFFDKLPLLYQEALRYLPGVEISFGAVGDAYTDSQPLQIRNFNTGPALDAELSALYPEGGGGGQHNESYELTAYYDLTHCNIPNALHPFYFLLCDEGFYSEVNAAQVKKYIGTQMTKPVTAREVFQQLNQKFKVYILRCPYSDETQEALIHKQWQDEFGNRVLLLENPARVVDCILGILAYEVGKMVDFHARITARQTSAQVASVNKTLQSLTRSSDRTGNSQRLKPSQEKSQQSRKLV